MWTGSILYLALGASGLQTGLPAGLRIPTCAPFCNLRAPSPLLAAPAISALTLMRQSEVLDVLSGVADPILADPSDASRPYDLVSLNLVRKVDIDESTGGVSLELVLPEEAVSAGASDRVRACSLDFAHTACISFCSRLSCRALFLPVGAELRPEAARRARVVGGRAHRVCHAERHSGSCRH